MMKKIIYFILILFVFILGISLGGNSYTKNKIVDDAIEKFEEDIQKEDNNYEPIMLKPNSNIFNKLSKRIENIIDLLSEKIKEKL